MPTILRRPMFRGGQINSNGTGITANLEPRKKYSGEQQTQDAARRLLAKQVGADVRQQMMPSYRDQVLDFLTAFGASASDQPQTFGQAAGKTGANFASLFAPKVAAASKAGTDAYLTALKGADPQSLALYQKQAQDLFRISEQKQDGKFPTLDDAIAFVLKQEFEGKDKSQQMIMDIAKQNPLYKSDPYGAMILAEFNYKLYTNPNLATQLEGRFKGLVDEGRFMPAADGSYVLRENKTAPKQLNPNDVYLDRKTRKLFYFDGKTKLVPMSQ